MLVMKRFISGSKISNVWFIQTGIIEGQDFGFFGILTLVICISSHYTKSSLIPDKPRYGFSRTIGILIRITKKKQKGSERFK